MVDFNNYQQVENELKQLSEDALKTAKQYGATSAEIHIQKDKGVNIKVRNDTIDNLTFQNDQYFYITVYKDHHKGVSSCSSLDQKDIQQVIQSACDIAQHTSQDSFNGLAKNQYISKTYSNLDLYHPWNISTSEAINTAKQLEQLTRSHDKRIINTDASSINRKVSINLYASSNGFCDVFPSTYNSLFTSAITRDANSMHREFAYTIARSATDLESIEYLSERAANRALSMLDTRALKTCEASVIFDSSEAGLLIEYLISALSGAAQYKNESFLYQMKDHQVFPSFFQLIEIPYLRKGLGSRNYDVEGVATQEKDLVKDGVICSYFLDSYYARKLKMLSTGHAGGISNLFVKSTGQSQQELLKQMHTGLLVTGIIGNSANINTGNISLGAYGFWIENGQIKHPVEEITIAGNLATIYKGLAGVGTDVFKNRKIQTGSILIDKMMISGKD